MMGLMVCVVCVVCYFFFCLGAGIATNKKGAYQWWEMVGFWKVESGHYKISRIRTHNFCFEGWCVWLYDIGPFVIIGWYIYIYIDRLRTAFHVSSGTLQVWNHVTCDCRCKWRYLSWTNNGNCQPVGHRLPMKSLYKVSHKTWILENPSLTLLVFKTIFPKLQDGIWLFFPTLSKRTTNYCTLVDQTKNCVSFVKYLWGHFWCSCVTMVFHSTWWSALVTWELL